MAKQQISKERERYWLSVLNSITGDFRRRALYATFPKIQEVFDRNVAEIATIYPSCPSGLPKFCVFNESLPVLDDDEFVIFSCVIDRGEVKLAAFLPDMEQMERKIRGENHIFGEINSIIMLSLVVGFIHEIDHIALQVVGGGFALNVENIMDGERIVWAKTCKDTISVLIEEYRQELCDRDKIAHSKWIESERNVDSRVWERFIYGKYATSTQRRFL